ncbi:MAG: hypothetical protein PHW10_00130 [Candidatus Peribacteraceae bacterium]|nr:hypothetical protein [Candidatus Peribacteraceae bacterium]
MSLVRKWAMLGAIASSTLAVAPSAFAGGYPPPPPCGYVNCGCVYRPVARAVAAAVHGARCHYGCPTCYPCK